jgi:NADH-quinone oxidoreductase subunit A
MADPTITAWIPIAFLVVLGLVFLALPLLAGRFVRPKRPNPGKLSTYESGEVPQGSARGPVDVQYYMYVIVFLVLDIEVLFIVPWALDVVNLGARGLVAMGLFVGLIMIGWLYDWKKGALKWQS